MSYSYERSSKTLNEAYYSDSDSSDSYRGANAKHANSSRISYLGGPSFARADPSYARADPEQNMIASHRLPPMKEVPSMPIYRQSNYKNRPCYYPNNHYQIPFEESEIRPGTLLGRSEEEIYADLDRVVNGGRNRKPRDDTPSMMSDHTSPSPSTPSVTSPPVSPCRDPSPPPHIESQGYPRGYHGHTYGHKSHDSAENALVSSAQHMRIEPSKSVAQARVPSHYPVQVESSFAQTKPSSPYTTRAEFYPPMVEATRSTPEARPPPCPYTVHAESSSAIRVIEPSRNLALIPLSSLGTEHQARVIESPRMSPQPTPQPANQIEHPKAVAKPLVRLRTLAPRIIPTNATETRTMETRTIEPRNTPAHSLRAGKARALNKVDTSRLLLLADSALGKDHNGDEEIDEPDEDNEVTYLPAFKRQRSQKLENPPRPPPQKKRGRYECKLCSQVFTRNFDLTRHVRTIHETRPEGDILSRTCPACGEVQSRDDSHKRHMVLVPFSCGRRARILGKPAPPARSESFYAMCRARGTPTA